MPSRQEEVLHEFAKNSLGAPCIFMPKLWGNGREPADMIFLFSRTMFLFNMTAGKSYLEDLCNHNVYQARDRLIEWRDGKKAIRGKNAFGDISVFWSDVDEIVVISVVDGPHSASMNNGLAEFKSVPKVKACVTITGNSLYQLALLGGGPRDVLQFLNAVIEDGDPIGPDASRDLVLGLYHSAFGEAIELIKELDLQDGDFIAGVDPLSYAVFFITKMREGLAGRDIITIIMDWHDIAWLSVALPTGIRQLESKAPDGKFVHTLAITRPDQEVRMALILMHDMGQIEDAWQKHKEDVEGFQYLGMYHVRGGIGGIHLAHPVPGRTVLNDDIDELAREAN